MIAGDTSTKASPLRTAGTPTTFTPGKKMPSAIGLKPIKKP